MIPWKFNTQSETLEWCNADNIRFTEPFFSETITQCLRIPSNKTSQTETPVEALKFANKDFIKPSGFIFHVSRCGSTLISQLLSALPQCRVLSEPPVIDEFLYWLINNTRLSEEEKGELLKGIIAALGWKNMANEKNLVIKFDCWHIEYYPFIRKIFPEVPAIFVYRDPLEVINSHKRIRGMQMVPGLVKSNLLQNTEAIDNPGNLDLYSVFVLEVIFKSAIDNYNVIKFLPVNYNCMPEIIWTEILQYFGIEILPGDIDIMKARAKFDAKNTYATFNTEKPKGELPEEIKIEILKRLYPLYDALEKIGKEAHN